MKHSDLIVGAAFAALLLAPIPVCAADAHGEIVTAATHADLAAKSADVATVHMHLHHAVNCLEGPGGKDFDPKNINPCANSGSGAIPDSADMATKTKLEGAVMTAEAGIAASDLATAQKDATDTASALKAIK